MCSEHRQQQRPTGRHRPHGRRHVLHGARARLDGRHQHLPDPLHRQHGQPGRRDRAEHHELPQARGVVRAITINGMVRWSDASGFNGIPTRWLKLDRCRVKGSLYILNVSNSCIDSCTIDTLTNGQQNIIRIQPGDFFDGRAIYEKLMDSDTLSNNSIELTSGMASIPGDNQTQWVFYLKDCVSSYGSGCPTTDGEG